MNISEFLEKWGRTLFETPLAGEGEPAELAEIRLRVLDEVREKSYRSGGRKLFPYDLLRVRMRGVEESKRGIYSGGFFRQYLECEVQNSLRNAGCRFPENLRVEVDAAAGTARTGEAWLTVEAGSQEQAVAARPPGRLVVQDGTANVTELRLDKARINIGRVVDVYRAEGLYRRNDLAFVEDTPVNRTVSREHAHIRFDRATGEYRLFNDRWYPREGAKTAECGTWIVRDGMSQEVHRDSRGVKLEPGDEIRFGRAVVVFQGPVAGETAG